MSLSTIYLAVAMVVLALAAACFAEGIRHDPARLLAIIAAAALWPVVAVGLMQLGGIRVYSAFLRSHTPTPASIVESDPMTRPMDHLVRLGQHFSATPAA